jgi:hypothetical protein
MISGNMFERSPFTIAWWWPEKGEYMAVIPKRALGSTMEHRLPWELSNWKRPLKIYVEGPFHEPLSLDGSPTVILAASGHGLFAALPVILYLVERRSHNDDAKKMYGEEPAQRKRLKAHKDIAHRIDLHWDVGKYPKDGPLDYFWELENMRNSKRVQIWASCDPSFADGFPKGPNWHTYNSNYMDKTKEGILRQCKLNAGQAVVIGESMRLIIFETI